MNQILDMISQWNGIGQGFFFLIVLGTIVGLIGSIFKYIAVCFRGWPPPEFKEDESESE